MKRRWIPLALLLAAMPAMAGASPKGTYLWNQIADGFSYTTFSFLPEEGASPTTMHALRIDPKKFRLDVVAAKNEREGSTAGELARQTKALLVINGGFFTPEHTTIGLIVKDGRELSPIHGTSWWSIFAMAGDAPAILAPKEYKERTAPKGVRMAIQAGPRLAINGKIPRLKENVATRSAVGITADGKVVIAITQGPGISMNELARRMSLSQFQGGLECPNAMAFDGGSSSQLYAKLKKFELSLPNIARVTNGLAVFGK